ncbi:MAG: hypothetical protein KG003_07165 [Bacteroidetes bacterium]|nr:hypothetical protein [Bacteroidota bacterium]
MKSKYIQLTNPCSENWDLMSPSEKGRFCEKCSKNVIDFTRLDTFEISEVMKKSKGEVCARINKQQLNLQLFDINKSWKFNFPNAGLAAGFALASTITLANGTDSVRQKPKTEMVQTAELSTNQVKEIQKELLKATEPTIVTLHGMVQGAEDREPIENAKVTFFTIHKTISTLTQKDGTFSLEIPEDLILEKNVFRVSYDNVSFPVNMDSSIEKKEITNLTKTRFLGYETHDYIFTKKALDTVFLVRAEPIQIVMGGISILRTKKNPSVVLDGKEIAWEKYEKICNNKNGDNEILNYTIYYFDPEFAMTLYGNKVEMGLHLLFYNFDKNK